MSDQSEFSYKMTGLSYTANDNDEVTISSEWEGTATGFGAVFGTLRATMALTDANAASGPCTFVGGAAPDNGSLVLGIGEGTWERPAGEHKWTITLAMRLSNGDQIKGQGVSDLATRTWTGTFGPA